MSKCTSNSVDSTSSGTSESDEASNPTAVDPSCCSVGAGSESESTVTFHSPNAQELVGHNFTDQEELKFQVRFEENCDVYDAKYVSWLEINHPKAVPDNCYLLPTSMDDTDNCSSLADYFANVPSCEPVEPSSPSASSTGSPSTSAGSPPTSPSGSPSTASTSSANNSCLQEDHTTPPQSYTFKKWLSDASSAWLQENASCYQLSTGL